jgi:acyl-coenzyme A synthetase/AMP-(fatty) acid ligase
LFTHLDCSILITTNPPPPTLAAIPETKILRHLSALSVQELLNTEYDHFPFEKTFEEARNEPLVALHTTGTTGHPKPIVYTHDYAAAHTRMIQLQPIEGYVPLERSYQGGRLFFLLPPFHVSLKPYLAQ